MLAVRLEAVTLFVAAARPALILGLPIGVFAILLMLLALIIVHSHNGLSGGVLITAWFAAQLLALARCPETPAMCLKRGSRAIETMTARETI